MEEILRKRVPTWKTLASNPKVGLWTDDYSNLLQVFLIGSGKLGSTHLCFKTPGTYCIGPGGAHDTAAGMSRSAA